MNEVFVFEPRETMNKIAHIENNFTDKFGIPRQSGLVDDVISTIVFEPKYRNPDAIKGLNGFSHLWIIWVFDAGFAEKTDDTTWSPMVRPPKLGGNTRMGVFATRSPNRPNPIGLSCVRIVEICDSDRGPLIRVAGADLKNNTPILDIKPYLPFTDSHPEAKGGFAEEQNRKMEPLGVEIPSDIASLFDAERLEALCGVLAADPRPHYQKDSERIYALEFAGYELKFQVRNNCVVVVEAGPLPAPPLGE